MLGISALTRFGTTRAQPELRGRRLELAGQVGITTASLDRHLSAGRETGKIALLDLPAFLRDQFDLRVLDLNSNTIAPLDSSGLDRFRVRVEKAGCLVTNLKMNQRGLDLAAEDPSARTAALREYKQSIDRAAVLGASWARPLPLQSFPVMEHLIAGYRELIQYGSVRKIGLLVENYGWLQSDAEAPVRLIQAIGTGVSASPDTGNWSNNAVRYEGLSRMFPLAVTCDFKARALGPRWEHDAYDLQRCFEIGWKAGFRGPWCIEHLHEDRQILLENLSFLNNLLKGWIKEKQERSVGQDEAP